MAVNHLDIYRHLPKTNCGYCQERTCLAFALETSKGRRKIKDCPYIDAETRKHLEADLVPAPGWRDNIEEQIAPLRRQIAAINLESVAARLGGEYRDARLRVKCLGKPFVIDPAGHIESEVHINPWVTFPLLKYVLIGGEAEEADGWISFDELSSGPVRAQYFRKRCENPLRELLDAHLGLFADIMGQFEAQIPEGFVSDRAWLLRPLPKVPVIVLYWMPEEGDPSRVKILFNRNVERFLDPEGLFTLVRGLVEMFERLVEKHRSTPPKK